MQLFTRRVSFTALTVLFLFARGQAAPQMLPTESILEGASAAEPETTASRSRLHGLLNRQEVREQMARLGVDENEAEKRLAALSDAEVKRLNGELDSLPAGGDSTITLSVGAAIIIALLLVIFL